MPQYIVTIEGKRYKVNSERELTPPQAHALALRGIGQSSESAETPDSPQEPASPPSVTRGMLNLAGEHAGEAARFGAAQAIGIGLPLAGTMVGGGIGGPMGALGGEMAGSLAATGINDVLGLQEAGPAGYAASVALPPVARGISKVIKGVAKRLPGVGTALQEEGAGTARTMVEGLAPKVPSDALYQRVAQYNPPVQLDEVKRVAQRMLDEQMKLAPQQRSAPIVDTAEGWLAMATAPDGADFQSAWLAQKQLRQKIWGGEGLDHHARGQIDAAIMKDFEAIPGPVSAVLKGANTAYRRERATESLGEIIESGIAKPQGQADAVDRLNAGAMLKKFESKIRNDDLFAGAFTSSEQQDIRSTLTELSKIPLPGPVSGAMYGAGLGLGAGSTGFALGLDPQIAAGVTATMTILPHRSKHASV
jgi:hypothetical protein